MDYHDLQAELRDILSCDSFCLPDESELQDRGNANVLFLNDGSILALPRTTGDSRYVYGDNGFTFWIHAAGYIYANDGLFSLFTRKKEGEEPVVAFFLGIPSDEQPGTYQRFSLLPVPALDESETSVIRRFTIMNKQASYFVTQLPDLLTVVRATVDEKNRMAFTVFVRNTSDKKLNFFLSSYFRPFCRHQIFESDEDRWFGEMVWTSAIDDDNCFDTAMLQISEDVDRFQSDTHLAVLRGKATLADDISITERQTNTSRLNFVGDCRRNLSSARSLLDGKFPADKPITTFNDLAIASDINTISAAPAAKLRLDYVFQLVADVAERDQLAGTPVDPQEIDDIIVAARERNESNLSSLTITIDDLDSSLPFNAIQFNQFFEHLKHQVSVCGLLKGYMQLAPRSLIGIRDVFQALEGLQLYRPKESREKMLEGLSFTTPSGRCPRQYSLPAKGAQAGTADLRPFIDQGVWIITTVHSYLQNTGDAEFLEEQVGYHKIIDEDTDQLESFPGKDSVLKHLFRIMDYLNSRRDYKGTKLLCALYGDWNDALDGLGIAKDPDVKYGTGVSVMATLQYYQNCREMINILTTYYPGKYEDKVESYRATQEALAENLVKFAVDGDGKGGKRIVHGWGDQRSYLVGSFNDPDGAARDGITSNAFWVISGMLEDTPEFQSIILEAFDRLDSKYGLMTFNPAFPRDCAGVGRIPKLPPGTAENGATYVHATLFGVWAYFMMGQAKTGWDQISKILPFTELHDRYTHSPFVMPNSYSYNPEKGMDGESMNDWQTGSSNVLLKLLVWYVFGYKPDFDGLRIQVAQWTPFGSFSLKTTFRGKSIDLQYRKDPSVKKRQFIVNDGEPVSGYHSTDLDTECLFIPQNDLQEINSITVVHPIDR